MEKKREERIRPPIVTLMGHVDHGKTTLLDAIRKTNVVSQEHGGITQHIGAYQVTFQGKLITFIDTPGHSAFEKMRSRGAEVADMVILVVAGNEGVKPQTIEAIRHIRKAETPLIIAVTKTDLASVNLDKIKKQLQAENIVVESLGGEVPVCEVAAPKGKGIVELLEMILLVWQLSPQPSRPAGPLEAVVIESFLDRNRGPVVSVIVKLGTLKVGQKIEVDGQIVTVRALIDDQGQNVAQAEPAKPVEILGFKQLLGVGTVVRDLISTKSQIVHTPLNLVDIIAKSQIARNRFKVVIKADVAGTLEAILANLPEQILVISSGVGEVSLTDVSLAKTSQAPILAFNVKASSQVKSQADKEGIVIRNYKVIYELLSDIEDVTASFEQAKKELKVAGRAQIVATFEIDGKKIAGAMVTNGRIKIGDFVIIKTGQDHEGHKTKVISLKRFKKDVDVVSNGQECGVGFEQNLDFQVGDIIELLG